MFDDRKRESSAHFAPNKVLPKQFGVRKRSRSEACALDRAKQSFGISLKLRLRDSKR